jgi:hypothetical protein
VLGAVLKPSKRAEVRWNDVSRAVIAWVAFAASVALMPVLDS